MKTTTAPAPRSAAPVQNAFCNWLDTFLDEKGIQLDRTFTVPGPSGENVMTPGVVVAHMKATSAREQKALKDMLVRIDFANAPVVPYLKHLARAIAL